jgi:hypothetical protein
MPKLLKLRLKFPELNPVWLAALMMFQLVVLPLQFVAFPKTYTVKGLAALRGNPNMDSCALSVVSGAIAASGRITVDSILGLSHFRGNPDIDSCVLTTVGGAVTLGRSFRRSATAADTITSISRLVNAGGADTVVITIGGVALKFVADVE